MQARRRGENVTIERAFAVTSRIRRGREGRIGERSGAGQLQITHLRHGLRCWVYENNCRRSRGVSTGDFVELQVVGHRVRGRGRALDVYKRVGHLLSGVMVRVHGGDHALDLIAADRRQDSQ